MRYLHLPVLQAFANCVILPAAFEIKSTSAHNQEITACAR
jgi:hypothetical protein